MDNPGDWLYIVLMAVAVVTSLISAGKKKRQEAEQQNRPQPDYDTDEEASEEKGFWDVLQDMQKQEEARQQEVRRQQQARAAQATTQRKKQTSSPFLSGETISRSAQAQSSFQEIDPEPILKEEAFKDPEELRKAVIYAEILNRKY